MFHMLHNLAIIPQTFPPLAISITVIASGKQAK
jgi:hypothetical protein